MALPIGRTRRPRSSTFPVAPRIASSSGQPAAADLFGDVEVPVRPKLRDYWRGLLVAGLAVLASAYIADRYSAPATLMGLLVGLSLNFLGSDKRLHPGLGLAASTLLRIGIVLLGARVTFTQITDLGPQALLCVVLITTSTILAAIFFARLAGFDRFFGALVGGAVAICGASAALAFAAMLGDRRVSVGQLTIVLVGISVMSAAAMFVYPIIAHGAGMTDRQAGFFLGASIHDVAQALGAGYTFSDAAGQTATIVKLSRVALLAPALALVGFFLAGSSEGRRSVGGIPWFVLGFIVLVAINSTGIIPGLVGKTMANVGTVLVVAAVAAAGVRSPMKRIVEQGARPLLVIGGATIVAGLLALSSALVLL